MTTVVYVEGGGDGGAIKRAMTFAFLRLLSQAAPGVSLEVRMCGPGSRVVRLWQMGREEEPAKRHLMLVDSEIILPPDQESGFARTLRLDCRDEDLGIMATCTESWVLADLGPTKPDYERYSYEQCVAAIKKLPGTAPYSKAQVPLWLASARWSRVARLSHAARFGRMLGG